ncbi:MAG: DUF2304 domain-containing protein [Bacteroidales bacterium]|nr:DUF2304 domain-containing protein [Bacteroidales bacterium]MCF8386541.1 DUF2304 domain-containing protein [Bacteroidales bacterium]MCF8398604.1 DUF2304 domain-containing protein [Bacteroidales bacterium]
MYNGRIQLVAILGSIILIIFIFLLIRKRKLKEEYSVLWLFFSFVFLILSVWRGSVDWIAAKLGIAYAPAALLLVLVMAIYIIMIEYSMIISKLADTNKNLSQEVGILKEELEELRKEVEASKEKGKGKKQ